jgi:hypothetical protein
LEPVSAGYLLLALGPVVTTSATVGVKRGEGCGEESSGQKDKNGFHGIQQLAPNEAGRKIRPASRHLLNVC